MMSDFQFMVRRYRHADEDGNADIRATMLEGIVTRAPSLTSLTLRNLRISLHHFQPGRQGPHPPIRFLWVSSCNAYLAGFGQQLLALFAICPTAEILEVSSAEAHVLEEAEFLPRRLNLPPLLHEMQVPAWVPRLNLNDVSLRGWFIEAICPILVPANVSHAIHSFRVTISHLRQVYSVAALLDQIHPQATILSLELNFGTV